MRLRTLLATSVAGTLLAGTAGALGAPAQATRAPSPAAATTAGSVVAWGDPEADPMFAPAATVPTDLTTPAVSIASTMTANGVVTSDGHVRVWGSGGEVDDEATAGITDAVAVTLANQHGAVLHADGKITAWGNVAAIEDVPADLRAKAIAVSGSGTGYAVRTDGTLATWGTPLATPIGIPAEELTNLVDISIGSSGQVLVLRADGTVSSWINVAESPFSNVPNLGGKKVTQISTGGLLNGVLLEDGTVKVWGLAEVTDQPDFAGKKAVSLAVNAGFGTTVGAVTEDGVVHTWGGDPENPPAVHTHPASLTGQPVASIAMGMMHAAVIVTTFRDLTKPTITGTPQVGQTLTAKPATFNLAPDAPATGQWFADAAPIAGQTGTTLVLDQAVVGKKISYHSTATRSGKTVASVSNELGPVTAITNQQPPITKAKSTVSAKAKATGKTKKVAKKVTITVTVKTTKGVSPAGKVTVTLKGKTKKKVHATVNAKGKATVTVKKVKRGKYKAQLSYAGNDKVASSKATAKFKV